jgi:hypothetical protein
MDEVIAYIVTAVLSLGVVGVWLAKQKWIAVVKEGADALSMILESIKDGKLTKEEVVKIKKEIQDVVDAFKAK